MMRLFARVPIDGGSCRQDLFLFGPTEDKGSAGKEQKMIQFEEEIKKFKPCTDLSEVEAVIYKYEAKDVIDVLNEMIQEMKEEKPAHE